MNLRERLVVDTVPAAFDDEPSKLGHAVVGDGDDQPPCLLRLRPFRFCHVRPHIRPRPDRHRADVIEELRREVGSRQVIRQEPGLHIDVVLRAKILRHALDGLTDRGHLRCEKFLRLLDGSGVEFLAPAGRRRSHVKVQRLAVDEKRPRCAVIVLPGRHRRLLSLV